ncbi:MAG: hypothetical protein JRI68_24980 [Deltaproteobacteria bacterium]|nr:hypothetical protein [Deltaproteobacteria bacterium]
MRDTGESVWLFDGGDAFGNASSVSSLDDKLMAEYLLRGMNLCGYYAITLGEEDFRFGETFLAERLAEVDFVATSANVTRQADGQPYAAPFFTKTIGQTTVGVIGVMHEEAKEQVEEASSIAGVGVTLEPITSSIDAALTAMGAARSLAEELPEVKVVVASHEKTGPTAEQVEKLAMVSPGYDGKWVGKLGLVVNPNGGLSKATWDAVPLDDTWEDHPELAALYQEYLERLATEAENIVNDIPQETPDGGSYVGSSYCVACHQDQATHWATTQHAQAFATLEHTNHDYSPSCFPCHTVGFGYLGGFLLPNLTPAMANVQCESCHGAGADHVAAPALGFAPPAVTQCTKCHTTENSPQFDLGTYLPQVQH